MHIVFLHEHFPFGGAEKVTLDICRALNATPDCHATIASAASSSKESITWPEGLNMKDLVRSERCVNWLKELHPDVIVVAVDVPLGVMPELRQRFPDTKILFHLHSTPLWQVKHKLRQGRGKQLAEKFLGLYTRRYTRLLKEIAANSDRIITLCDAYNLRLGEITGKPNHIIPIHDPLGAMWIPKCTKRQEVLYMGRLSRPDKRVDRLLRIWERVAPDHPDWVLKLVGDGPDAEALREQARAVPRVTFCGASANPAEHYATASVVCLTSDYEGWPLVLAEAMAARAVPMAFDCSGGVHELLSDNRGILIAPGDEAAYADALDAVLTDGAALSDPSPLLRSLEPNVVAQRWLELIRTL